MVTGSYIFIPLQFCRCLSRSPHTRNMPWRLLFCLILFAFFFFLCGTAHFLLAMRMGDTAVFTCVQWGNAVVSTVTAIYLIPLMPDMFLLLDTAVNNLQNETQESKSKLFTFMAFLCHEIRNPLFAITSSAECLHDTPLTQEQLEEVTSIGDSSLLMLRLVNDVLDLSKLDSGKLQLECREFDLHSLLKRLADNMARQVQRKHQGAVQMQFLLEDTVPQFVLGDSVRILQIVYNLLSNSCKFTSEGTISLTVNSLPMSPQVWQSDEANDKYTVTMSNHRPVAMFATDDSPKPIQGDDDEEAQVFSMALLSNHNHNNHHSKQHDSHREDPERTVVLSIIVSDTGIGIPPERLEDIFEPYTQAKLSDFRQHGGTGLGLSIISSLTKTMGGTISVTSRPGEGAKFHLKLPVKLPDETVDYANGNENNDARRRLSLQTSSNMDYVGELLPSNQAHVPQNFLKCQRMPDLRSPTSEDIKSPAETKANPNHSQSTSSAFSGIEMRNMSVPTQPQTPPFPAPALFPINTNGTATHNPNMNLLDLLALPSSERTQPASKTNQNTKPSSTSSLFNLTPNEQMVLVVDDNSVNRKILAKMLNTFGIQHNMACNGKEAVDAILASRNNPPNASNTSLPRYGLVFMDVSMPIMDGNTAIQTIRQANINVPIVALSANVLSEERNRTISLGADEFHTKPILRSNLKIVCERYLLQNGSSNTKRPSSSELMEPRGTALSSLVKPLSRPNPSSCRRSESDCSTASTDADLDESDSLKDLATLPTRTTQQVEHGDRNV
jgi:signal transduction histidine kinase/DNA-binding response OmpR family regulator